MRCLAILLFLMSSFITLKPDTTVYIFLRIYQDFFLSSAFLYPCILRVSLVGTQKHVALLLPPSHSASAMVKSLDSESHMVVSKNPAAPYLCSDLFPGAFYFWASLSCSEKWGLTMPTMRTLQESGELMDVPDTWEDSVTLSQIRLWNSFSKRVMDYSNRGLQYLPLCLFFFSFFLFLAGWLAES